MSRPAADDPWSAGYSRIMIDTTDPERAAAYLTSAYGGTTKPSRGGDGFRFRHVRLGAGPLHIDTFEDSTSAVYRADPIPGLGVIRMHRGIRTVLETDERCGPGDLALHAQPGQPSNTLHASVLATIVHVPLRVIAEAATNRPEDELGPLRFAALRPASASTARSWLHTVEYVTTGLTTNPDGMAQPLLARATTQLVAASLLATFPSTWAHQPRHIDRTDATSTALSRAVAFIDANADLGITAVDIARAAHVTVRAIQLAFRHHLDTTPMAYLRRVRLDCAHRQLQAASPGDGTTVMAVAARWGYLNPSRFAAHYREIYGHSPRHTLHS